MSSVFDRLDKGIEEMARGIQSGIERGRLGLEKTGVVSERTALAAQLGMLAWRKARGHAIDEDRFEALCQRLDDLEQQLVRLDRAIAAAKGEEVSVGEGPEPPAAEAEAEVERPDGGSPS